MRRAAWPKPGWPTANANSSTPAANSKSCSVGIVRPLEVSVAPPTVGPGQRMVAAEIDGLGRHLTEVLDDDTSALSVRARIHADAHIFTASCASVPPLLPPLTFLTCLTTAHPGNRSLLTRVPVHHRWRSRNAIPLLVGDIGETSEAITGVPGCATPPKTLRQGPRLPVTWPVVWGFHAGCSHWSDRARGSPGCYPLRC